MQLTATVATTLAFSIQPTNSIAGDALSPAVQVEIRDASGRLVTTARDAVTLAIGANPGSGVLTGTKVVNAINGKIAQEQQIQTEKHRVEVARLQSEQQRLLNQTLTAEALMKQYLEVLHDMKTSNNLVVLVPTEGGVPLLDLAALRRNLKAAGQ